MRQLGEKAERIVQRRLPAVTVGAAIVVHHIMIPETTIPGASCRRAVKLQRPALAQRQQDG
jgi:hypothetical protein